MNLKFVFIRRPRQYQKIGEYMLFIILSPYSYDFTK